MRIIRTISEMQNFSRELHREGKTIGFVPTMGCLHQGHLSLVKRAKKECDIVVVSIYVNPTQFGPNEDFNKYPRDLKRDREMLKRQKADVLFLPSDEEVYGKRSSKSEILIPHYGTKQNQNSNNQIRNKTQNQFSIIPPDCLVDCLCGKSRPGHFAGVALVVAKLFNTVRPDKAYFGQKDYQQTLVIKKLVKDLNFNIKIIVCPTVREKDGLAMSSRNRYLNNEEREAAILLSRSLKEIAKNCKKGDLKPLIQLQIEILKKEPLIKIDYVEIRGAEDLSEISKLKKKQKLVIAGAIKVGKTRLIDNVLID